MQALHVELSLLLTSKISILNSDPIAAVLIASGCLCLTESVIRTAWVAPSQEIKLVHIYRTIEAGEIDAEVAHGREEERKAKDKAKEANDSGKVHANARTIHTLTESF